MFRLFVFLLAILQAPSALAAFEPPTFPRNKIIVLGTYHMANPGLDSFNMEADDVLKPDRQAEIKEIVDGLANFKPTKILVESVWDSDRAQTRYAAYLAGEYELSRDEIDQIGYRLAGLLEHKTVYPIDYDWGMGMGVDLEKFEQLGIETNKQLQAYGKAYLAYQSAKLKGSSIGQFLSFMNSEAMIDANHFFYMAYALKIGAGADFQGPEMVANWYKRNLRMVHNIMRVANPDGSDRLLVIVGQGHAKLINQFLGESPYFDRQDVRDYLPVPE